MEHQNQNTCACPGGKNKKQSNLKKTPFLLGLLIAILPKCPFCILAYSSALTLCNGSNFYMHQSGWTSWISIFLAAFTLAMVLINYRGRRTLAAAGLILLGSALITRAELYTGQLQLYYGGVALLFAGIWANGSFLFFTRALQKMLATGALRRRMLRGNRREYYNN